LDFAGNCCSRADFARVADFYQLESIRDSYRLLGVAG
jgi:hypothetical protein